VGFRTETGGRWGALHRAERGYPFVGKEGTGGGGELRKGGAVLSGEYWPSGALEKQIPGENVEAPWL